MMIHLPICGISLFLCFVNTVSVVTLTSIKGLLLLASSHGIIGVTISTFETISIRLIDFS